MSSNQRRQVGASALLIAIAVQLAALIVWPGPGTVIGALVVAVLTVVAVSWYRHD